MREYIERAAEMLCASTDDIQTVATLLRQIDALKAKVKELEAENAALKKSRDEVWQKISSKKWEVEDK